MKTTYELQYDCQTLALVEIIDSEKSREAIKEMVEFWGNWKNRLKENNGNYTTTWLKQLAKYILNSGVRPDTSLDNEGWYELNGSYDIKITYFSRFEFDEDEIEITEAK